MGHLPAEILGLLFSLIATLEGVLEMMQKSKTFLWDFVVRKKKWKKMQSASRICA